MRILIINGPNLNFLGIREVGIYGKKTYEDLECLVKEYGHEHNIDIEVRQTNFEGIIVDLLQYAHHQKFDAVILNAGALTHYSYTLYDAIKSIHVPVIEVHLTDPDKRDEAFRKINVIHSACTKTFKGNGFNSYLEAIDYIIKDV